MYDRNQKLYRNRNSAKTGLRQNPTSVKTEIGSNPKSDQHRNSVETEIRPKPKLARNQNSTDPKIRPKFDQNRNYVKIPKVGRNRNSVSSKLSLKSLKSRNIAKNCEKLFFGEFCGFGRKHGVWKSQKKVSASYVYILSGQKLIKNAKNGAFWRIFDNLKLAVKQCYTTGQF